ncbi:MAG: ParB N-terminal domain-containing protein, partial [Anaerolineales bacterium]|nr:ParB N-terminal domain-containing protein [Anaerolineales bacterium]
MTNAPHARVLICDPIDTAGVEKLAEIAQVDQHFDLSPADLLAAIGDYDALIVRSATKVTAEVIARGTRLKVIGRAGAGLDNIDITAAQEAGIAVVNSPDANTLAVAEHTLALMLGLARRLVPADQSLKAGRWDKKKFIGTGLSGKTVGIIGFGRIGLQVAQRAQAFGMRILVNQRRRTPEVSLEHVTSVDLDVLLRESDFVTLHVPLKPETRGLIGAAQLALMKPSAYLINTARGGIVDEAALLAALDAGQIAGAGLDVFGQEPAVESDIAKHEKVLASPHIGASTHDAKRDAALTTAVQICDILNNVPANPILPLRVIPMNKIFPHESIDPRRVARLAERIEEDGLLMNPPIVTAVGDEYVVLDGATRTAAFKQLGYPHIIAQICDTDRGLGLRTWYHVIGHIDQDALLPLLDSLPDLTLVETTPEQADDDLFAYAALCYLHMADGRVFLVQPSTGTNRLDALNLLTETYIAASRVD